MLECCIVLILQRLEQSAIQFQLLQHIFCATCSQFIISQAIKSNRTSTWPQQSPHNTYLERQYYFRQFCFHLLVRRWMKKISLLVSGNTSGTIICHLPDEHSRSRKKKKAEISRNIDTQSELKSFHGSPRNLEVSNLHLNKTQVPNELNQ